MHGLIRGLGWLWGVGVHPAAGPVRIRPALRRGTLALAVGVSLALALPALAAAATTTIDFDGLAPGTQVSNQFDSLGIDFISGEVPAGNAACPPVVTDIGSGAHSGTQVADISCRVGEFPDSSMWANLTDTATTVSADVGFAPAEGDPETSIPVTLTGYDADGNAVASQQVTVPANEGTQTPIQISSDTANIVSFGIAGGALEPGVQVDDISFDVPAGSQPDFTIGVSGASGQLTQGGSSTEQFAIRRVNGSTGPVSFSASGLPAGVHASFDPNPTTSTTTMTLTADPSATAVTSGAIPTFKVTATPDSATAGTAAHSITRTVEVLPVFVLDEPSVQVPPCSVQVPIKVSTLTDVSGPVTLSAANVPGVQASFDPSTIDYPAQKQTTLTLTGDSDVSGPSGTIAMTATGANGISDTWHLPVSRVAPSITSVSPGAGSTPQGVSAEGTTVTIRGHGICPGSAVYFGNTLAKASGSEATSNGDQTTFTVTVPSLATSGKVYVVPPGGNFSSAGTVSAPFTVDSFRNTDGFAFDNSDQFQSNVGGYDFSDLVDVFGDDATHIEINLCYPFGDCSINTGIPNVTASLTLAAADLFLGGGQCFGFGLASQRLVNGRQSFSPFPPQPGLLNNAVWNLDGPDRSDGSSGASAAIARDIHLTHLEQLSAEYLGFYLDKSTGNAANASQTSLMNDVYRALDDGDHPLVAMRQGAGGHVVVAYAIDQTDGNTSLAPGDRVIDVYNPNKPFTTGENTTDGGAHQAALINSSQIIVHSNGHWTFNGFLPEKWGGGPGSLVVAPTDTVPLRPSLPGIADLAEDIVAGDADATQVSAPGGHDLIGSGGSIDNSAKTGIPDATEFAPEVAAQTGSATGAPSMFLLGHPGDYTTTVHGTGGGQYHQMLLSHGNAVSVTAATRRGDTDELTAAPNLGELRFGRSSGTGARGASVELAGHGDGGQVTATVATTVPTKGQAGVSFTGHDAGVDLTAGGQATTATLTLTWAGKHGLPQTFRAGAVKLAPGDRAAVRPSSWSSLGSGRLAVSIRHRNGKTTRLTLRNRVHPADRYSVRLGVTRKGKRRQLQIRTRFTKLVAKSDALVTFEVLRGRRLVAKHVVSLTGKRLHRGLVEQTFPFKPAASKRYSFRAGVAVLSPTKQGGYSSQRVVHVREFK